MPTHARGMLLALAVAAALSGCARRGPGEKPERAVETVRPAPTSSDAKQDWADFVADAREKCKAEPGCSVDYEAYHEYEVRSFGVMVVAWKDSEYVVDLYRWNAVKKKWEPSPTAEDASGSVQTDLRAASEQWSVPLHILETWIGEAEAAMHRKTESRDR